VSASVLLSVGERIRCLRRQKRMTQQHLAELSGLSRITIINMEQGEKNVMLSSLVAVAEVLGVNMRDLF